LQGMGCVGLVHKDVALLPFLDGGFGHTVAAG
jgi:hypothetical protein